MKILQVPFCFAPDPMGGTERYVEALALELQRRGRDIVIAAPAPADQQSEYRGVPVRRFATARTTTDLRQLYGEGDATVAANFAALLDAEQPALVHLHALSPAVSVRLLQAARQRGVPVIFTYHTPTVSCPRGSLLRLGREICDGVLHTDRCAICALHGHGMNPLAARVIGRTPISVGNRLARSGLRGGLWTALRMTELIALRHASLREFLGEAARIVVLCDWTRQVLLRNGIPAAKITLTRHGLVHEFLPSSFARRQPNQWLQVAYAGRLHPLKGPDLLVKALRQIPAAALELHIYGIVQPADARYALELKAEAAGDARIIFHEPVSGPQLLATLAQHDLLAVPSRCLETGPLVVLEAFAVGTPVLGVNLGGVGELVTDGVDGLLVDSESVPAWAAALQRCATDRGLIEHLRSGIRPPRTMATVADETLALYESVRTAVPV